MMIELVLDPNVVSVPSQNLWEIFVITVTHEGNGPQQCPDLFLAALSLSFDATLSASVY